MASVLSVLSVLSVGLVFCAHPLAAGEPLAEGLPGVVEVDGEAETTLEPAEVSGLVADELDQPVVGAELVLVPTPDRGPPLAGAELRQTSDVRGRFVFDQVTPGRYLLGIWKVGFCETRFPVELAPAEKVDLGKVALARVVTLHGRVVDRDDQPIEGVRIRVRPPRDGPARPSYRGPSYRGQWDETPITDADGGFEMAHPSCERKLDLLFRHPEYQKTDLSAVELADEPLEVQLDRALVLRGRVVDSSGAAAVGVDIWVSHRQGGKRVWSDAEGRFEVSGQPTGVIALHASGAAGVTTSLIELPRDPPTEEVRLVLSPGASLRGQLRTPENAPVTGAHIVLTPLDPSTDQPRRLPTMSTVEQAGKSDENGEFLIDGLEGGLYRLRAEEADYQPLEHKIELPPGSEKTVMLNFSERPYLGKWLLKGKVAGDDGPVEGAKVQLVGMRMLDPGSDQTLTLADGRFELKAPNRGLYTVVVDHTDYATLLSDPVEIADDQPAEVALQLSRGVTISGKIQGVEPDETADLQVSAAPSSVAQTSASHQRSASHKRSTRVGQVEPDGTYRIDHLAPGRWRVMAKLRSSPRTARREIAVEGPGEDLAVDLNFERAFEVRGLVMRNGEPMGQGQLSCHCSESDFFSSVTLLEGGDFQLTGVPAGSCQLAVSDQRRTYHLERGLEVDGDEQVVIEFDTFPVEGQVLRRDDLSPVLGATVTLVSATPEILGRHLIAASSSDGRFSFPEVPEAEWRVVVTADGYEPFEDALTVSSAGVETQVLLRTAEPAAIQAPATDLEDREATAVDDRR